MKQGHGNAVIFVLVIVGLVLVAFVGYKMLINNQSASSVLSPVASQQMAQPTPRTSASPSASVNSGLTNTTDTSNAQLDKDLQEVGTSVSKLDQDNSTANQDVSKQSADNSPSL